MTNSALLLRLWDYFIVHGWKAIFKVSLAILQHFEEQMLAMNFEVLLTQIVNLPTKYFIREYPGEQEELQAIASFDRDIKGIKLPTMLLERLKKEFDENFEVSSRRTGSTSSMIPEEKPPTTTASTPKSSGFRSLFSKKD